SLTRRSRSRRISISTSRRRITPPSRIGIGNRLKIARLRLTAAIKPKKVAAPSRAACPESWAIRIGPSSDLGDMRRSTMPSRNLNFCFLHPTGETDALFVIERRSQAEVEPLSIAQHPDFDGAVRAGDFFNGYGLPGRRIGVVHLNDLIALANAGFVSRSIGK